jgi:hypothetical protein
MKIDLETFGVHAVLQLIEFFPDKLSKQNFWPD